MNKRFKEVSLLSEDDSLEIVRDGQKGEIKGSGLRFIWRNSGEPCKDCILADQPNYCGKFLCVKVDERGNKNYFVAKRFGYEKN